MFAWFIWGAVSNDGFVCEVYLTQLIKSCQTLGRGFKAVKRIDPPSGQNVRLESLRGGVWHKPDLWSAGRTLILLIPAIRLEI